jgi:succinate dehydrogenase / fumarate reductase flavoprotein subunit
MAEGGCAASMGNANSNDNWQVHFRDTMRGGKFLNNWRMAELHAKEAPDRVWELESYGALFDRTADGRKPCGHACRIGLSTSAGPKS